jgi:hypothetical protein
VAPVATEYRLLGANEAFLATLRSATGGRAIATAAEPWTHDLETTASFTELWPWLLILALLLWPLDIALRRVSLGRRELVDARRWVGRTWRGWRGPGVRTATDSAILATRERAGGAAARAAILGKQSPTPTPAARVEPPTTPGPAPKPAAGAAPTAAPTAPPPAAAPVEEDESDTISRLRDAKRRSRGG